MDLKRIRFIAIAMFAALLIGRSEAADAPVVLKIEPWPSPRTCEHCVTVQYDLLEMHLPLGLIDRILALSDSGMGLHIILPTATAEESVSFLTVPPERLLKRFEQAGLLDGLTTRSNEQFFDLLGSIPGSGSALAKMRKIEGLENAVGYTKRSKGPLHVYWIRSSLAGGSQRVYFVIDGKEDVYLMAGEISPEFYEAVLSAMKITPLP